MFLKPVIYFLVFMAVLAVFGKLHWIVGKRLAPKKCKSCGRYLIGRGNCQCKRKG